MEDSYRKNIRAIILCGGKGNKIFPFSYKWQKSCLPIGNTSNVERIIKQLRKLGILDIWVMTDYHEKQVKYSLRNETDIQFKHTSAQTIHQDIADLMNNRDVFIHYGDVYASDVDIENTLLSFEKRGSTILVNDYQRSCDYICAKIENDRVMSIYGHPREHYVNMKVSGVFGLKNSIKKYIEYSAETFLSVPVGGMPQVEFYLEQCLMNAIEDGELINAVEAKLSVVDMDFPWDILFANEKYCIEEVSTIKQNQILDDTKISSSAIIHGNIVVGKNVNIGDHVIIDGNCMIGDNVTIQNGAFIEANCVIGSNSEINGHCKISSCTVIGKYNRIGFTAEVTGVIFDRVSIVHHSEIYGVVGTSTDIAAGCQVAIVRFDDLENPNKVQSKVYANKFSNAAFIGDYTRTGVGNIFLPGVKIGCNCALGPGLIIQGDVDNNKLLLAKQEIIEKEWNSQRYGW